MINEAMLDPERLRASIEFIQEDARAAEADVRKRLTQIDRRIHELERQKGVKKWKSPQGAEGVGSGNGPWGP